MQEGSAVAHREDGDLCYATLDTQIVTTRQAKGEWRGGKKKREKQREKEKRDAGWDACMHSTRDGDERWVRV